MVKQKNILGTGESLVSQIFQESIGGGDLVVF